MTVPPPADRERQPLVLVRRGLGLIEAADRGHRVGTALFPAAGR